MAFTQKSKFTSSGLMNRMPNKAKLINNSKTAFHQELPKDFVATKTATKLDGTVVPTQGYTEETVEFDDDQGLGYDEVYESFKIDNTSGGRINTKTGVIYNNVDEFRADAIADRTKKTNYQGSYDSTSGTPSREVTPEAFKDLYGMYEGFKTNKLYGGPRGWFKLLEERGVDPNDGAFKKYMSTQGNFARKREVKEKEKQKRKAYCEQNPKECYKKSSSTPQTRTIEATPRSETYVVPKRQN